MISWLLSPNILLAAAITIGGGFVVSYHVAKVDSAYERGVESGKGSASVETLEAAKATAEAQRQAEAETTLPSNKDEILARCKRAASCRERNDLK